MPPTAPITIVSGLPRSGTSLMMRMLHLGGFELLTDGIRAADPDNPRGYYEFERVKGLPDGDTAWLGDAGGKAVKIVSGLIEHLPPSYEYRIVLMTRAIAEVLASQRKMLVRRGEDPDTVPEQTMTRLMAKHLERTRRWLKSQPNVSAIEIAYQDAIRNPRSVAEQVVRLVNRGLDIDRMVGAVDPSLYRNRSDT